MEVYENTPENAARIGWNTIEEDYLIGDQSLPYVFHDTRLGLFFFIDDGYGGRYSVENAIAAYESGDRS